MARQAERAPGEHDDQSEAKAAHSGPPHPLTGTAQDDRFDITTASLPKKGKRAVAPDELPSLIAELKVEMFDLAERLEFEKAAAIRDRIHTLEELQLDLS